uniref:NADP-dependent oxidoreductase domain-containing protein n=1 Tax=Neobodo designis TaxID=312471 RepID=A0A7S1QFZ7_NEODS|mmetsp:Transcript_4194/g.13373  ORF Transcript_4194/g.13373 Transcript_4194/m.13373 type:complete len:690 (+) Transcript_4194:26-2095(+)
MADSDPVVTALTASGFVAVGTDPAQREQQGKPFPLVLVPNPAGKHAAGSNFVLLQEFMRANHEAVRRAASEYGAVLFSGFDVRSGEEWSTLLNSTGIKQMSYVGGAAVRKLIVGCESRPMQDMQVLTTNESPPSQPIPFHHELAQTANPPDHICFYCLHNDAEGGSTPLIRSDFVWEFIVKTHPDFAAKIEALGVKYRKVAPGRDDPSSALGRSWRSMFHVETKEAAEAAMTKEGNTWEWLNDEDDSCRVISPVLPAVRVSSNGAKTFYNQLVAAYTGWVDKRNALKQAVVFADDTPLPDDVVMDIVRFMNANACAYRWSPGRFVIVDNSVAYHSREPFTGRRRIYAAIGQGTKPVAPTGATSATHLSLHTGARMPQVGFGCWKVPKDVCADTIYQAIKAGYRLIDSACDYGNEQQTGAGIRRAIDEGLVKREDLFVVSKLWNTFHRPENVEVGLRKTLADLGLEYVDLYLIHFPIAQKFVPIEARYPPEWIHDPSAAAPRMELDEGVTYQQTWQAMEAAHDAGLAKHIGFCNIGTLQIRQVLQYARVKPAVLQVEMHPQLTQQRLLRMARESGIQVMAFSNLGASSYVELGMAQPAESLLTHEAVAAVAKRVGRTPAQVLLRWGVQRGTVVIPKTSKPERLGENLSLFDFALGDEDMAALDGLNANRRYNDPGHFCEAAFNTFCPIYD